MNLDEELASFCASHDAVYIYGAGYMAGIVFYRLKHLQISVSGFVTTYGGGAFCGLTVFKAKDIMDKYKGAGIILGMNLGNQTDVKRQFARYPNFFELTSEMINVLHKSTEENGAQKSYDRMFSYYDWWSPFSADASWFTRFVRHYFPGVNTKFNFYSVFGKNEYVKKSVDGVKIFFSGESLGDHPDNVYSPKNLPEWHCLKYVDLSMSFEKDEDSRYLRFPLWILYVFEPEWDLAAYRRRLSEISRSQSVGKESCVCICSHDLCGTRSMIYKKVKHTLDVKFAGKWRNNTDDLWKKFNDNKRIYLRQFRFNICAEKLNSPDYCTEKLFDAFIGGSIPLYYGADNSPEPNVINQDAVIFFSPKSEDEGKRKLVYELEHDNKARLEFMSQDKFKTNAAEFIYETYIKALYDKISILIRDRR